MKKRIFLLLVSAMCSLFSGCSSGNGEASIQTESQNPDGNDNAYIVFDGSFSDTEEINTDVCYALVAAGYSLEQSSTIQGVLNQIGIYSIAIESQTGNAANGLNAVVCFPNGETDTGRRFYFTTEDGIIFYAGYRGEDLYDADKGGFLKSYGDIHIPETKVTVEVYESLREKATQDVKDCLISPESADFGMLDWAIGREDDNYKLIGRVTSKNSFGVKKEMSFSVWYVVNNDVVTLQGIAIDGIRVK